MARCFFRISEAWLNVELEANHRSPRSKVFKKRNDVSRFENDDILASLRHMKILNKSYPFEVIHRYT